MLYFLYVIGFNLAKVIPLKACYFAADLIASAYYYFAKKDREVLGRNLRVILGDNADDKTINKNVKGVFRNFAKYLADFFKFSKLAKEFLDKKVEITGTEHIGKCLSEGKGAIFLTPHLGNWELGLAVVAALGYPINGIVLEHKDKRINDFFNRQRTINNIKIIHLGIQLKKCFKVLENNEMLAIAGDKDYTSSGECVEFFGKKALMPKGAAFFSLKTGAPIIVCACVRKEDDSFTFHFEPPIKPEPTRDQEKDIRELMGKYLSRFEHCIREHPDQWYAFQEIWNQEAITQ